MDRIKYGFTFLIFFIFLSCSSDSGKGILGIEVPVGSGKVSNNTPYLISGVYEESPAYKAGVRPGDVIIQINEMTIANGMIFDEIYSKYLTGKAGTRVTLYIKRGEQNLVFDIIMAARN